MRGCRLVDKYRSELMLLQRSRDEWVKQACSPEWPYRMKLLPGLAFDSAAGFDAAE
jgi:hypothetical protein